MTEIMKKLAKTVTQLKCLNIYIKAQFKSPKYFHQTTFETLKYPQQTML
jgi:hypothetical protein